MISLENGLIGYTVLAGFAASHDFITLFTGKIIYAQVFLHGAVDKNDGVISVDNANPVVHTVKYRSSINLKLEYLNGKCGENIYTCLPFL